MRDDRAAMWRNGDDPVDIILWALRSLLIAAAREEDVPAYLPRRFESAGLGHLYLAVERLVRQLVARSHVRLEVHDPLCPCTAPFEESMLAAVRALQRGNTSLYNDALGEVMDSIAVRLSLYDMSIIACSLTSMQQQWPASRQTASAPDNVVQFSDYSTRVH
ncbi:MAG: hypothetical protein AAFQ62_00495 [Pseudomonadota bacterium]